MAKIKVLYPELVAIRESLIELGKLDLPIPYELGKNLKRVNAALKDAEETLEEVRQKYVDREPAVGDVDGDIILYAINKAGDVIPFDENKRSEYNPQSRIFSKISDKKKVKEFQVQEKKLQKDEFEVDFHEIPMLKLQAILDKSGLKSGVFLPLIDYVFVP